MPYRGDLDALPWERAVRHPVPRTRLERWKSRSASTTAPLASRERTA